MSNLFFPGVEKCRCGQPAHFVCHLCQERLCGFHKGDKPTAAHFNGYTRIRLQPVCFPNCTSGFGQRDETAPQPKATA